MIHGLVTNIDNMPQMINKPRESHTSSRILLAGDIETNPGPATATGRIIPRKLNAIGVCGSCENDAQAEFMTCVRCMERFHVNNCSAEQEVQCTATFLRSWPTVLANYPNFGYTCDECREKTKLCNEDILVNRLAVMEENIAYLVKEIKTIKLIPATTNETQPPAVTSYAAKAAVAPAIIVIEKKQGEDAETYNTNMNKLRDAAVQSSANVIKTYRNGVHDTVLICRNESSKKKLMPHVSNIFAQHKVSTPPSRVPTVTIKDIETKITNAELIAAVQRQNHDNGQVEVTATNFNILFIKEVKGFNGKPVTYHAVVRVSDDIRDSLKSAGDRVFINLQSCRVSNRFFIRRCNKCQEFKHFHKECKSEVSVCGRCGEQHDTTDCTSDTVKCTNCARAGYTALNHETSWWNCPAFKKEQEKVEKTIPYFNSKNS